MVELRDQPSHADQVIAQETSGMLVLLRISTGQYYSLNELGGRVWKLCDGTRTVSEIIELIGEEYDAPRERIRDDVIALLRELGNERLVSFSDQVAPGR